ncbi:MAG TPA: hypothetical protein VGD84_15230 [Pseudonocardiaceae bacterium]
MSQRRLLVVAAGVAIVAAAVASIVTVGGHGWRDDARAASEDVSVSGRAGHDDPYIAHVTVHNHSGHPLNYRIDGVEDETTTSNYPGSDRHPFHVELDRVAAGAVTTVEVSGPGPSGYVINSPCRVLHVQTS